MDNKKIGELIAKLRKEKRLTQQSLGDLVGVGATAVSKWERGLTLPDIGIINELSQILGISSDELLEGEIKEDDLNTEDDTSNVKEAEEINETNETTSHHSQSKKILIILLPLITVLIIVLLLIYRNNKTYTYRLLSIDNQYYVDGKAIFHGTNISIKINKIKFKDKGFASTIIKNYEYDIATNGQYIFRYGYMEVGNIIDESKNIEDTFSNFKFNYNDRINISRKKILRSNLLLTFRFIDKNNNEIVKEIEVALKS